MPALNHILGQVRAFYNLSRLTDAHRSEQVRNPFYTLHSTIPAGIQAGRSRSQFSSFVIRFLLSLILLMQLKFYDLPAGYLEPLDKGRL